MQSLTLIVNKTKTQIDSGYQARVQSVGRLEIRAVSLQNTQVHSKEHVRFRLVIYLSLDSQSLRGCRVSSLPF